MGPSGLHTEGVIKYHQVQGTLRTVRIKRCGRHSRETYHLWENKYYTYHPKMAKSKGGRGSSEWEMRRKWEKKRSSEWGNNTSVLWERRRRYILEEGAVGSRCGK